MPSPEPSATLEELRSHLNDQKHGAGLHDANRSTLITDEVEGWVLFVNQRTRELFGFDRETLLSKRLGDLYLSDQPPTHTGAQPVTVMDVEGKLHSLEVVSSLQTLLGRQIRVSHLTDVSLHHRKQATPSTRAAQNALLFEQPRAGVIFADATTGQVLRGNQAAAKLLGVTHAELLSATVVELLNANTRADAWLNLEPKTGGKQSERLWFFGTEPQRPMRVIIQLLAGDEVLLMLRDGTRHHQERTRRKQLEEAQAVAQLGHWKWDVGNDNLEWSKEVPRICGLKHLKSINCFMAVVHPDDRAMLRQAINDAVQYHAPLTCTHRIQRADGTIRWVRERGRVTFDAQGLPDSVLGTLQDVTTSVVMKKRLDTSLTRHKKLIRAHSDLLNMDSVSSIVLNASTQMCQLIEGTQSCVLAPADAHEWVCQPANCCSQSHLVGWIERWHTNGPPTKVVRLNGNDQGTEEILVIPVKTPNTSQRPHLIIIRAPHFEDEVIASATILARMVTDALRVLTEKQAQRQATQRFSQLLDQTSEAVLTVNALRQVLFANRAARDLFHLQGELDGSLLVDQLIHPSNPDASNWMPNIENGPCRMFEATGRNIDGIRFPVEISVSQTNGPDARLITVMVRDLTAQQEALVSARRSQEQLQKVERVAALGRLGSGVAREFNEILDGLRATVEAYGPSQNSVRPAPTQFFREISALIKRGDSLTGQLQAFASQTEGRRQLVDVAAVLRRTIRFLRPLLKQGARLNMCLPDDAIHVYGDPNMLQRVVMNIATFSSEASKGEQPLLQVSLQINELETPRPANPMPVPAGDYAVVEVSFSSKPMPRLDTLHPFEPSWQDGADMDLAVASGLVRRMGAYITLQKQVLDLVVIRVWIPRMTAGLQTTPRLAPRVERPVAESQTQRVAMVVDDDISIQRVVRVMLKTAGYHVLVANDGIEALEVAAAHPGRIHLMVTDVLMPRLNGPGLVAQITALRPKLRILYISGFIGPRFEEARAELGNYPFLRKPFTAGDFIDLVRKTESETA